ncbi:hypothetical protein FHR99_001982 [Litorivivens lipolytica]|uniref:NAD(FAD)-utilizing dehydrogenase n=1 Tax=Litorivivens lipolytica TaxID=1524264 RepID=A0A7W4Z799_9GAMM|nr:TIGR03862 family flavoprotein [Litorivivens lipolytica]MBB3047716.1 hypothetical protein [Litorivivens lipolytica]
MPATTYPAVVIGGGPAGLMAAEQLALAGHRVAVFDQKPTVGRKFLRAGIGGLNITHSEPYEDMLSRYGNRQDSLSPLLDQFTPAMLRAWCEALGIKTFVGSSGRVFPRQMKAAPLLRRWLERLRTQGVELHTRHRWLGWEGESLRFEHQGKNLSVNTRALVLALGGGSWQALGSDGRWSTLLQERGVSCRPFRPSNCGFDYPWPPFISESFGLPLKSIGLSVGDWSRQGDALLSHYGIEGSLIYAASSRIRDAIDKRGECTVYWNLCPNRKPDDLQRDLTQKYRNDSIANALRKLGIKEARLALLKALTSKSQMQQRETLPALLTALPQTLRQYRPIDEAISTAGGIDFTELDKDLMIRSLPGVFCAGEMLDWEAPTGGYLLNACFASGLIAGQAAATFLKQLES